jgi:formylmethanofuran dehydrogenase subunit E
MMPCTYSSEQIEKTIAFHGHSCPGLAIGIRAAELVQQQLGRVDPANLLAVVETDMCGVDAIQFLTGCTFGKGNLIHRDVGKMAFTFFERASGKGFRAILNPAQQAGIGEELRTLMKKVTSGQAGAAEKDRSAQLRAQLQQLYMQADLEEMFITSEPAIEMPRGARVLDSLPCAACGEMTMESRTRRFDGQTLCIPCFEAVEQKI